MPDHDIKVTREALDKGAQRYESVTDDHAAFVDLTNRASETKPAANQNDAVAEVLSHKDEIIGAMRSMNYTGGYTARRLSEALSEAHDKYQRTEDNNSALVQTLFADLGKYPPNIPLPNGSENERTDWTDMSAARRAEVDHALRSDWRDIEAEMSALNLDFTFWNELGGWLANAMDHLLAFTHLSESLDTVKGEWLPVYQIGQALQREGDGYGHVYQDLEHDRDVLHSNWEGVAGDAASGAMTKCAAWYEAANGQMQPFGEALKEAAESNVVAQIQAVAIVTDVVNLIPEVPSGISMCLDGATIAYAIATKQWKILLAAVWDLIVQIASKFFELIGVILLIWHFAIGVVQVIRYALASLGPSSMTVPPSVWS